MIEIDKQRSTQTDRDGERLGNRKTATQEGQMTDTQRDK